MKNESALLHRWAAQLEDYDFEILHRPGKNQGHVDALSSLPTDNIHLLGQGKVHLGKKRRPERFWKGFIKTGIRNPENSSGFSSPV